MAPGEPHAETAPPPSSVRRVIVASLIGTSLEWYDFFIYGTAAALVFNKIFFPGFEPLVGTLPLFLDQGAAVTTREIASARCSPSRPMPSGSSRDPSAAWSSGTTATSSDGRTC